MVGILQWGKIDLWRSLKSAKKLEFGKSLKDFICFKVVVVPPSSIVNSGGLKMPLCHRNV